jgi:transposase
MFKANQKRKRWKRYKKIKIEWGPYDKYRKSECERILNLGKLFKNLDKPVQRREFRLSTLAVLLLFKVMFNVSYRTIASVVNGFRIYELLGLERAPCFKTIQRTMEYLSIDVLKEINKCLIPMKTSLAAVDASGLKTRRKGAWVIVRFNEPLRKRDFKKIHIFVDLETKKIINCVLTKGTASDSKQVRELLDGYEWFKVEVINGDGGYDTREDFNAIANVGAIPGIKVRKNASTKSRGCPIRRKTVISQREDYDKWRDSIQYRMRCVVESIFSGTERRFGDLLASIREEFRKIEVWLRTILWNVCIYPR